MSEFEFSVKDDGSLSLDSAVFQALGAASTCWDSLRQAGVFDSTRAKAIGDRLLEFIRTERADAAIVELLERVRTRCPACAAGYDKTSRVYYINKRTPEGPV